MLYPALTILTIVIDQGTKESEFDNGSIEFLCRRGCIMHCKSRESSESKCVVRNSGSKLIIDIARHSLSLSLIGDALLNVNEASFYLTEGGTCTHGSAQESTILKHDHLLQK